MSIVIKLNMQLFVTLRVIYRFGHMVVLTLRRFFWNTKKCAGLVHFCLHAFFKKKCDLGHHPCPGYKLFLIFWKNKKQTKTNKNKKYIFRLKSQHAVAEQEQDRLWRQARMKTDIQQLISRLSELEIVDSFNVIERLLLREIQVTCFPRILK